MPNRKKTYQAGQTDASHNLKNNLPLKHNKENFSAIATFHNNPDYIAGYIAKHLGKDLVMREIIQDKEFPDLAIKIYDVYETPNPFYITYIPKEDMQFNEAMQKLTGKNQHIEFLRNTLFKHGIISASDVAVHFYDDDKKNYENAQNLQNVKSYHVNAHSLSFSVIDTSNKTTRNPQLRKF